MGNTRRLWRVTGLTGLLASLVLAAGFIYGVKTVVHPKGEELQSVTPDKESTGQEKDKDKLQLLAMGDSLTKGLGDDTGEGYAGKVKNLLAESQDLPVYIWNFAVNGATTLDMLQEIEKPSASDYISQADIIMFTIGGNDLFQAVAGGASVSQMAAGAGGSSATSSEEGAEGDLPDEVSFDFRELSARLPDAVERLGRIIDLLAELNPDAQIVYTGLYHPFMEFDESRVGAAWIGKWNDAAFQAANRHDNVTVVPTYDLFQNRWEKLLYTDHFHPNTAAYDEIAHRVLQSLREGNDKDE